MPAGVIGAYCTDHVMEAVCSRVILPSTTIYTLISYSKPLKVDKSIDKVFPNPPRSP
jgi:hypothetical protein